MYLKKIQILSGELIDLKPKIKEKKAEDKEKKAEQIQPQWDKAELRVLVSSAFAGGYELEVIVPVPTAFIRDKKGDNKGEFIKQLHSYINERIGKWMGTPYIGGFDARSKGGILTVQAKWHFDDAFFAYALGLNLDEWRGINQVVEKGQIANRMHLAEKAFKELQGFRDVANKKLTLRTQDKEERSKIWKEEFMPEWMKLTDKWKERGLNYVPLSTCDHNQKSAVGETMVSFLEKVQSHYVIAANPKVAAEVEKLMSNQDFVRSLPDFIAAANAAILVAHKQQKPEMVKFNALSLALFQAIKSKDVGAANNAADALVKSGHGEAFGLK